MNAWLKSLLLLVILSVGFAFGGYMYYKNSYVKPRAAIAEERVKIEATIQNGKSMIERMQSATTQLSPLYTRSFPLIEEKASLQYEMWLSQMTEFCNMQNVEIDKSNRSVAQNRLLASQGFRVKAECELIDLTQFLYEFYWTSFLHRVTALNIVPQEGSDLLQVTMRIQCLTILYRTNPNQAYPLRDQLPLSTKAPRQLASQPFAAYSEFGEKEIFRAVRSGVDFTALTLLTGTPVITDENGVESKSSLWNLEAEGRTISLSIGDELKVGSFVATIEEIDGDLVVLKQKTGQLWAVLLGAHLSEALAIPSNMF